ncbi:MAG: hypothetical protein BWY79_01201 [Actinobacteria bacterium ADurb.Bin444]|nr:MAG: hypothetical protein BWY79_01201 [Actinobacteria bacterium ADurb.Bin444]
MQELGVAPPGSGATLRGLISPLDQSTIWSHQHRIWRILQKITDCLQQMIRLRQLRQSVRAEDDGFVQSRPVCKSYGRTSKICTDPFVISRVWVVFAGAVSGAHAHDLQIWMQEGNPTALTSADIDETPATATLSDVINKAMHRSARNHPLSLRAMTQCLSPQVGGSLDPITDSPQWAGDTPRGGGPDLFELRGVEISPLAYRRQLRLHCQQGEA